MSSTKREKDSAISSQSYKHRKGKTREVSSRFLSPTSTTSFEAEFSSPGGAISPIRRKQGSDITEIRKHRSMEDPALFRGQLWPSSSSTVKKNYLGATLADHLGNDRLRDFLDRKSYEKSEKTGSVFTLTKQRSCSVFKRFENDQIDRSSNSNNNSSKENHQPAAIGGSTRYTGKIGFPGNSSSSVNSSSKDFSVVPGRLSVDENVLYGKSESFTTTLDSESDYSDVPSGTSDLSSKKLGIEVPSKYMNHVSRRSRRGTSDSNIQHPLSSEDSSFLKKFTIKNAIKRANSLSGYKSSKSQWALSPGRSGSPPMSVESKEKLISFSSLKPPTSPSHAVKGVDKFLNMGFDFFRSKKSSPNSTLTGLSTSDTVYQLRLLDNRLMQWRYANAKAKAVNKSLSFQAESNLLNAWNGITKLQRSVMQKKMQYEKEKLEMKLDFIIQSQIKLLEAWGDLERQHISAITVTKDCLHSIVCKLPLIEGAEVDIPSVSVALKHAYELTVSMKSMLTSFPRVADEVATLISKLAEVVSQEKLLLDEFHDLFQTMSFLEVEERSMKCGLIQLQCWQQQYLQQQLQPENSS
ncbi:QWRF motif-containing protein 3 [Prosopis cineraria]|uniref:QWRF motif-containing protein 3 n=1 Tax=Prosopis cineraria TaxID=364024 RepID=UPI00240F55CE|nr:QWRF motif-containing protein 3 [Prosopis cineraria]